MARPKGYHHSPESIAKMRESHKGLPSPRKGKTHTIEAKRRIGEANQKRHMKIALEQAVL